MDVVRSKSATLCWELMFTRPRFKTADMIEQHRLLNQVADWLDAGSCAAPEGDASRHQRGQSAQGAREARVRNHDRQAGPERLVLTVEQGLPTA
jgi:hypothetical protein